MRIAGLVLLITSTALAGGKNVLKNGGFEKGMLDWALINNSGNTTHDFDKKTKKEGKQSLHLHKTGGPPFDPLRVDLGKLPVGKKVSVTAWFKGKDVQNGWFKIFFYDSNGETIKQGADVKPLRGTYDWKEISIKNKVPKKTASAAIFILLVMPGELWIDDVRATAPGLKGGTGKKAKPKALDIRTKSWLDRNAIRVKSLDFNAALHDLGALKKILKDVRIVQLGEQSHMDGESFRAKARLVKFLHKEMGFEVFAFESGLYECERANKQLAAGQGKRAMHASIFGIWRVEQVLPLFDYMARTAGTKTPLRLSGFDTRGSGLACQDFLVDLYEFLAPVGELTAEEKTALAVIDQKLNGHPYNPPESEREAAHTVLKRVRGLMDEGRAKLVEQHGERSTRFYSRCLDNYVVREEFEFSKNGEDKDLPGNMRDKQMALNLQWLADVHYPDKKIITWAATSHQARNLTRVTISGSSEQYERWKNMGQYVHDWYGKEVYTIAFAAYEGEAGRFKPTFRLSEPKEGSFEELLNRYGQPLVFVPLRGGSPFESPLFCSPMSYTRTIRAPWPEVVDAIFYIQEMKATRFVPAN
ncbi:MAG: erythromycin esterase family protein [Planctomycetota bacterium]|jgi:erythromycin esterase